MGTGQQGREEAASWQEVLRAGGLAPAGAPPPRPHSDQGLEEGSTSGIQRPVAEGRVQHHGEPHGWPLGRAGPSLLLVGTTEALMRRTPEPDPQACPCPRPPDPGDIVVWSQVTEGRQCLERVFWGCPRGWLGGPGSGCPKQAHAGGAPNLIGDITLVFPQPHPSPHPSFSCLHGASCAPSHQLAKSLLAPAQALAQADCLEPWQPP